MDPIIYKGHKILEETEPWAVKYGLNYVICLEGNEPDNESLGFKTIQEAKDYIDNNPA
jgi:hypothetical protein